MVGSRAKLNQRKKEGPWPSHLPHTARIELTLPSDFNGTG
jgi:hypothetical protein